MPATVAGGTRETEPPPRLSKQTKAPFPSPNRKRHTQDPARQENTHTATHTRREPGVSLSPLLLPNLFSPTSSPQPLLPSAAAMRGAAAAVREPDSDSDEEMEAGPSSAPAARAIKTRRKAHQKPQVRSFRGGCLFLGVGGCCRDLFRAPASLRAPVPPARMNRCRRAIPRVHSRVP
jgi:hypothetical protein